MKDYDSPFGKDFNAEQNTALWDAIHSCAHDHDYVSVDFASMVYEYLGKTPRTSLVVELVQKLNEMSYKIVKA